MGKDRPVCEFGTDFARRCNKKAFAGGEGRIFSFAFDVGLAHHPHFIDTVAVSLWSINERLAGRAGVDVPQPIPGRFLSDIVNRRLSEMWEEKQGKEGNADELFDRLAEKFGTVENAGQD